MQADTTDEALQGQSDVSASHKIEGYSFDIHPIIVRETTPFQNKNIQVKLYLF